MNEDMNRDAGTDLADRLATLFEPVSGEASAIALATTSPPAVVAHMPWPPKAEQTQRPGSISAICGILWVA